MLRQRERYVNAAGELTDAGWLAFRDEFDGTSRVQTQSRVTASSQTAMDFTGVPSWVNRITVLGRYLSTNGTSPYLVQVGDGAIVATGYVGTSASIPNGASPTTAAWSAGIILTATAPVAGTSAHFSVRLDRIFGNSWVVSGSGGLNSSAIAMTFGGEISLTNALDRVRVTTAGGVDTFDLGDVNIGWE
jgi:hypothetical protein